VSAPKIGDRVIIRVGPHRDEFGVVAATTSGNGPNPVWVHSENPEWRGYFAPGQLEVITEEPTSRTWRIGRLTIGWERNVQ